MTAPAPLDVPVHLHGAGMRVVRMEHAINVQIGPREDLRDGQPYSMQEWPLGEHGQLMVATPGNALAHVHFALTDDAPATIPPAPVDTPEVATALEVQARFGTPAHTGTVTIDGDPDWHIAWFEQVPAERWLRIAGSNLLVATDADGVLAAICVHAPVPTPAPYPLRLRADQVHTEVQLWHRDDGESHLGLTLHMPAAAAPDPGATEHHLTSMDGRTYLVIESGELRHLDIALEHGTVELPATDMSTDIAETTITWPPSRLTATLDEAAALVRIELGPEPATWTSVNDAILAGTTASGELASMIVRNVQVLDYSHDGGFVMPPTDGMDQAELAREMHAGMLRQFEQERAAAQRWAEQRPFPAYAPADAPTDVPRDLRIIEHGMLPGDGPTGVQLTWGDELGRMLPDGDRDAPIVSVTHEQTAQVAMFPEMLDEHLQWLHSQQMLAAQWNAQHGGDHGGVLPDVAESGVWGPVALELSVRELADRTQPATLVVDGEPRAARLVRTEHGFVAWTERDGWRVTVRSTQGAGAVPELVAVGDLEPFIAGQQRVHEWQVRMHEQAMAGMATADADAPAAALEARAAARQVEQEFDPVEWFATDIVDGWGGPDALRQRFLVVTRRAPVSIAHAGVARDGSVVLLLAHVSLPRPDGTGVGFTVGTSQPWWDHDADQLRAEGSVQPPEDAQGEYELTFRLLLERQADGSYALTTDLLRLLDPFVQS